MFISRSEAPFGMERIAIVGRVGYQIPLRIEFRNGEMIIERDVHERQERDPHPCIAEPSGCRAADVRSFMNETQVEDIRAPLGGRYHSPVELAYRNEPAAKDLSLPPRVQYRFPVDVHTLRVLFTPRTYDVEALDESFSDCVCRGLIYHDAHRVRIPFDLTAVVAAFDGRTLDLALPREKKPSP